VAVLALGAGAVMAQSGEDADGQSFLDRVAGKLGIDTGTLEQAITDARNDEIDQAVADGELTQEQADRLKEKLDDLPEGAPFLHGFGPKFGGPGFGFEMRGAPGAFGFGFIGPGLGGEDYQQKLADFLGVSVEDLRSELQADGANLASVAEAHGKSRDELKTFIVDEVTTALDARVADGDLTQEQADDILAKAEGVVDHMIDAEFGMKMRGGDFHFKFRGSPDDEDGSDATPDTPEQSGIELLVPAT
jgi:hypothetical protein